jgi:iron complex outermembrane receptor protein
MKGQISNKWLLATVSLAAFGQPLVSYAQTGDATVIPDIIVTAQRRDEDRQDVPLTVTVLGQAQIQNARIATVGDIVQRTPGVGFSSFPASEPRVAVRGIGSASRGASGDPSSAVFVDEIYNGRPAGIAYDPFDIARIEVLKGPQGTLFGRNVTGGAVNIVTNRPDLRSFGASVEGSYGNYNQVDLAGVVNVPVAQDTAAIRIGGAIHRHDGFVDRINAAGTKVGELDDKDSKSGRIQLRVEPNERVRFHLTADVASERNKGPSNRIPEYMQASGGFVDRFFVDPYTYKTYATTDGYQNRDVWSVRGKFEYDISFATVSYLGSYKNLKYDSNYDFDGSLSKSSLPDQSRDIEGGDHEKSDLFSHEFQIKSLPDSKVTWVTGIYNYYADTQRTNLTKSLRNPAIRTESIAQRSITNSRAGYVDVTIPLADNINIFGGARYTRDEKRVRSIGAFSVAPIFYVSTPYDVEAKKSWGAWSWRIGANWHLSRDVMVYGSVSHGFKSGGFQDTPANAQDAILPINPEFVTSYEIGQRGEFFGGRVLWNNSFYYTKYNNLQTRVQDPNGTALIFNAFATIYGYETEIGVKLAPGLRVDAGYAYTHARYDDFPVFIGSVVANYRGNRLDWTPEHKITVAPSYIYRFANASSIEVSADYSHETKIYDNENNNEFNSRPPTNFVDARLIFKASGGHWSATFWGKNLTKEVTKTYDGNISGVVIAAYSPPRTYGATLRWKY